jgi:hypothetical protein
MSDFVPRPAASCYRFEIAHDPHGYWTAREHSGLSGGTFFTRREAMRFALAETGGQRQHVHVLRAGRASGAGR